MVETVLLAILVLAAAGGGVIFAMAGTRVSRMWPAMGTGFPKSEPAEEGAPVPGEEHRTPEADLDKAA